MFQSIKGIIPSALKRTGIDAQVSATRVLEEAKAAMERMWGAEQTAYVEPVMFKEGTLVVKITSPSAAQALRTAMHPWMNEINRVLGQRKVQEIRVRREGF